MNVSRVVFRWIGLAAVAASLASCISPPQPANYAYSASEFEQGDWARHDVKLGPQQPLKVVFRNKKTGAVMRIQADRFKRETPLLTVLEHHADRASRGYDVSPGPFMLPRLGDVVFFDFVSPDGKIKGIIAGVPLPHRAGVMVVVGTWPRETDQQSSKDAALFLRSLHVSRLD